MKNLKRSVDNRLFHISGTACGGMVLAGPGPGFTNPSIVRVYPAAQDAEQVSEVNPYGSSHYGVNVTCGDVASNDFCEIITGPGPVFGPHVRGFEADGVPLPGLNIMAYGSSKWGAIVACGDIDGDGFDEILTGPGPGSVFGPHVRAFDYDGTSSIAPVPGVSFFAYGVRGWGVNICGGDIDGDGFDEILTGPGPGVMFGPHVRGWNVDGGPAEAIRAVSFFAYRKRRFGAVVSSGDLDGDGFDEIMTSPGPGEFFSAHIRGWDYDDALIRPLAGCSFVAWDPADARYGARVYSGKNLDLDGRDALVVGCGPDPSVGSEVKVFRYEGSVVSEWFSLEAFPSSYTHGTSVAAGRFLLP
jgi:fibronectin-binding autotransporter adhesin